jgi:hypothetical protein
VGEEAIAAGLKGAGAEGASSLESVWRSRLPRGAVRRARAAAAGALPAGPRLSRSTTSSSS